MASGSTALIDQFLDALWLEAGLSPNTLSAYRSDLLAFDVFLGAKKKARYLPVRERMAWLILPRMSVRD